MHIYAGFDTLHFDIIYLLKETCVQHQENGIITPSMDEFSGSSGKIRKVDELHKISLSNDTLLQVRFVVNDITVIFDDR